MQQQLQIKKNNHRKANRELLLNISMFLLNQEKLKNLFWTVKSIDYNRPENSINIGIDTTIKLGTTLQKMRTLKKTLAQYLFELNLTQNRPAMINFYVDRDDDIVNRVYNILDKLNIPETPSKNPNNKEKL
jgi:hypothetical protein